MEEVREEGSDRCRREEGETLPAVCPVWRVHLLPFLLPEAEAVPLPSQAWSEQVPLLLPRSSVRSSVRPSPLHDDQEAGRAETDDRGSPHLPLPPGPVHGHETLLVRDNRGQEGWVYLQEGVPHLSRLVPSPGLLPTGRRGVYGCEQDASPSLLGTGRPELRDSSRPPLPGRSYTHPKPSSTPLPFPPLPFSPSTWQT